MFEHRAGVGPGELAILEGQVAPVGLDEPHARIDRLQKAGVVDADRGHPVLMRVPGLQIVGMVVAAVRCGADVDDAVGLAHARGLDEPLEHLAPLVAGDAHRQGVRPRDVVLGVDA